MLSHNFPSLMVVRDTSGLGFLSVFCCGDTVIRDKAEWCNRLDLSTSLVLALVSTPFIKQEEWRASEREGFFVHRSSGVLNLACGVP